MSAPREHRVAAESCSESSDSDTETLANTAGRDTVDNDNEYANIATTAADKTSDLGENSSEVNCDESDLVDNCNESKGEVICKESDIDQTDENQSQTFFGDNFDDEEKQEQDEGNSIKLSMSVVMS